MKKPLIKLLLIFIVAQPGLSHAISASNAKALKLNIRLNAIQYAKTDKAFKIAKDLLKHDEKNEDLEHVALQVLSRPDTEERTRKILLKVYLKQNELTNNQKNRPKDLIKAARITGNSAAMSMALHKLGMKAYPTMVKALQCKKPSRRRKKSKGKPGYPLAQQSLAEAIATLVKKNNSSKAVQKSSAGLLRCFKCADQNTALVCSKAIGHFKKLDNRSINRIRTILVSSKDEQRKTAAAKLLARNAVSDKRYQRALEVGIRSRNELTRLKSATALYGKIRSHHGAKKALEKLGKSAKKETYRKQALQSLEAVP